MPLSVAVCLHKNGESGTIIHEEDTLQYVGTEQCAKLSPIGSFLRLLTLQPNGFASLVPSSTINMS
jgi:hypothetical protein